MLYRVQLQSDINFRGIAQLVEQWSPKPRAQGSSPCAPAILESLVAGSLFLFGSLSLVLVRNFEAGQAAVKLPGPLLSLPVKQACS